MKIYFIFLILSYLTIIISYILTSEKVLIIFKYLKYTHDESKKILCKKILTKNFEKLALYYTHEKTRHLHPQTKKKYYNDLICKAYISLDNAIDKYNVNRNISFKYYLKIVTTNHISSYLASQYLQNPSITYPEHVCKEYRKIMSIKKKLNIDTITQEYYTYFEKSLKRNINYIKKIESLKYDKIKLILHTLHKQNMKKYSYKELYEDILERMKLLPLNERLVVSTRLMPLILSNSNLLTFTEVSLRLGIPKITVIRLWNSGIKNIRLYYIDG